MHYSMYRPAVLLSVVTSCWKFLLKCHWRTVFVFQAVKRIVERNKLSEEDALKRIRSQMSNQDRVDRGNVILCTLWDYSVTQKQVI